MKAGVSWLHRRYGCHIRIRHGSFLHNTRQSNLHPLFYYGRFRQLVGKVNKGNDQPALLFCQSVQQFMFVYTVSLAYLTLYAVALHRTFEAALRNTDKNGASASSSSTGKYTTRNGKTENEREPPANIFSIIFFLSTLSTLCKVFAMKYKV